MTRQCKDVAAACSGVWYVTHVAEVHVNTNPTQYVNLNTASFVESHDTCTTMLVALIDAMVQIFEAGVGHKKYIAIAIAIAVVKVVAVVTHTLILTLAVVLVLVLVLVPTAVLTVALGT